MTFYIMLALKGKKTEIIDAFENKQDAQDALKKYKLDYNPQNGGRVWIKTSMPSKRQLENWHH